MYNITSPFEVSQARYLKKGERGAFVYWFAALIEKLQEKQVREQNRAKKMLPSLVAGSIFRYKIRRRPTLPHSCPCSTIGAEKLNFRVRDGNGCDLLAMTTENCCSFAEARTV